MCLFGTGCLVYLDFGYRSYSTGMGELPRHTHGTEMVDDPARSAMLKRSGQVTSLKLLNAIQIPCVSPKKTNSNQMRRSTRSLTQENPVLSPTPTTYHCL